MKKKHVALSAALLVALAAACDGPGLETRTFTLAHLEQGEAMQLISPYVFSERPGWPGSASVVPGALTVRETRDNLDRITRVLEQFDKPHPDVRLRFQLVEADGERDSDPAVADVVAQLRKLFRFEGYRLLGEALVTTGGARFQQRFTGTAETWQVTGNVYRPAAEGIRLQDIELNGRWGQVLRTSATVRVGQTLVLGSGPHSLGAEDDQEGTVILVVRVEEAG